MPTIRFTTSFATAEDSAAAGETRAVSGQQAQAAVAGGYAEIVRDEPPVTPESAAGGPAPETASGRRRARRGGERAVNG